MNIRKPVELLKTRKSLIFLSCVAVFSFILFQTAYLFQDAFSSLMSVASYLTWHNIFETISIIVNMSIFLVAYYTYSQTRKLRTLMLGSLLLLVAIIEFCHMLSFKGMPDFFVDNLEANRATTLWIISRLFFTLFFILAVFMRLDTVSKMNKNLPVYAAVIISIGVLAVTSYYPDFLPAMYVEGKGLTPLKIGLEYVIMLALAVALAKSLRDYIKKGDRLSAMLCGSLILSIFSELAFVSYSQVYDIYNYLGHIYKAISCFMIFKVAFIRNVLQPYIELFDAERKLRNYAESLDKTVEQRTRQLKRVNKRLMDDLQYAKGIQKAMLPGILPDRQDFGFSALYYPAERLSGDFYDIFMVDEQHYAFYICDVSGHGVPAAMLTVFLKQCIDNKRDLDTVTKDISAPSRVLNSVFESFNNTNFKDEVYLVLVYGLYNTVTKKLIYSSAGMNTEPLYIARDGEVKVIPVSGLPICKLKKITDADYIDRYLDLSQGGKLLFYTDGLPEAKNLNNKPYGMERLEAVIKESCGLNGKETVNALKDDLYKHIDGKKITDDVTFFIIEIE